jgi:hypothetical protein
MTSASVPVEDVLRRIQERFLLVEEVVVDSIAALDVLPTAGLSLEDICGKAEEIGTEINRMHAITARLVVLSGFARHLSDADVRTIELSFDDAAALGFADVAMDRHWRDEIVPAVDAAVDRINGYVTGLKESSARPDSSIRVRGANPLLS